MAKTISQLMKNRAAAAKRTASSLRTLAEENAMDPADRGVLLTAARIVEALAKKESAKAKTQKSAEDKFERDCAAAKPEATTLVAALPSDTTLDRMALVCMGSYRGGYLEQNINGQESPERLQRIFKLDIEDAVRDEVSSLAYKAAKEGKPVSSYQADLLGRFNRSRENLKVIRLAERLDAALAKPAS